MSSPAAKSDGASASGARETCSACGPALLVAVAVSAFITAGTWATVRSLTSTGMPHSTDMVCSGKATGRTLSSFGPSSAPPSQDSPSMDGWAITPADVQ